MTNKHTSPLKLTDYNGLLVITIYAINNDTNYKFLIILQIRDLSLAYNIE